MNRKSGNEIFFIADKKNFFVQEKQKKKKKNVSDFDSGHKRITSEFEIC